MKSKIKSWKIEDFTAGAPSHRREGDGQKSKIILNFALSFCILIFVFFVLLAQPAFAQQTIEGYQLSVGFPEVPSVGLTTGATLGSFFTYLFNLSFIISGLAGFVALVFGGIMYMTSGVVESKSKAREIIQGAFIGLLLLASTSLILNLIGGSALTAVKIPSFPKPKPPGTIPGQPPGLLLAGEACSSATSARCLSENCVPPGEEHGVCSKSGLDERCYADRDCDRTAETPPIQLICDQNIKRCRKPDLSVCKRNLECVTTTCCGYPVPYLPGTPNKCYDPNTFFRPFVCLTH